MIYKDENGRAKVLGDNELMHWKYIKKIREGKAFRYFYTPEEIRAYEEAKRNANNLDVPAEIWGHRQGKMKETKKIADEAFENRYKNLKKNAKETWEYAKPQSSSSMRKKNEKEYSRNLDKQMARSKDLQKRSDALNKSKSNTIENGGRLRAREDYYNTLNEKDKEKYRRHIREEVRLRRAEDRIKKAEKKKEKLKSSATKSMSSIRGESQDKISKGRSAVEKKINKTSDIYKSEKKKADKEYNKSVNKAAKRKNESDAVSKKWYAARERGIDDTYYVRSTTTRRGFDDKKRTETVIEKGRHSQAAMDDRRSNFKDLKRSLNSNQREYERKKRKAAVKRKVKPVVNTVRKSF